MYAYYSSPTLGTLSLRPYIYDTIYPILQETTEVAFNVQH